MKEKKGEHPFGDAGQIIALALFLILWIADSFFMKISIDLAVYIPLFVRLPIALLFLAGSIYLLIQSHNVLEGEDRPRKVISTGVFKYIRHPLYMSSILFYLALIISTASIISLFLWIVIFIFYDYIAGYEEKVMEMKFGEEYRIYKQKTGKWLPKL